MIRVLPRGVCIALAPGRGNGLFARRVFVPGEVVFEYEGDLLSGSLAGPWATQVDLDRYLDSAGGPDQFLNHSCDPSCQVEINGARPVLRALRWIEAAQELTFDYCTTEWDLHAANCGFRCQCGSELCRGDVFGFRYLGPTEFHRLKDRAAPHLLVLKSREL